MINRHAIRAILLTPANEILLLRIRPPDSGEAFWIVPGGGQEAGETDEQTLRRELWEELRLSDFTIGPVVWLRQHTFNWADKRICQTEQYHIVTVSRFEPTMTDQTELKSLERFHWWQVEDLAHAQERLTPLSLAAIVDDYVTQGPKADPPALEVLTD